jgi:hypothetical protein
MATLQSNNTATSHVSALYHDGCEFFDLPEGATLAELVSCLDDLAIAHEGEPIAVNLRFDKILWPSKSLSHNA